jgi:hypothetical protein
MHRVAGITAGPTLSWTDAATEAQLSQAAARFVPRRVSTQQRARGAGRDTAAGPTPCARAPELEAAVKAPLARTGGALSV